MKDRKVIQELQPLVRYYRETLPTGLDVCETSPRTYRGKGNLLQRVNIRLGAYFKRRETRLMFVSWMMGRDLKSTKELSIAEATAFLNLSERGYQHLMDRYLLELI